MKKYLLPKREKYYKAAMHIHTTCSDGKATPEEAKEEYLTVWGCIFILLIEFFAE